MAYLTIRIESDLKDAANRAASVRGESLSAYVRALIDAGLPEASA